MFSESTNCGGGYKKHFLRLLKNPRLMIDPKEVSNFEISLASDTAKTLAP